MIESLLIFSVSKYDFAIDLQYSPLILRTDKVLRKTNDNYESLDTKVFPIDQIELIHLSELLGLEISQISKNSRILIFEINEIRLGLMVDEVKYVMSVDEDAPEILSEESREKISSYHTVSSGDKNINFLNIEELISLQGFGQKEKNIIENKINIATIEDTGKEKNSNDLVALSVGIREKGKPFVIAVNRKGKFDQL